MARTSSTSRNAGIGGGITKFFRNLQVDFPALGLALVLWLCWLVVIVIVAYVWLGLGTVVTAIVAALGLLALMILCLKLIGTATTSRR